MMAVEWAVHPISDRHRILVATVDGRPVARCRYVEISATECHVYEVGVLAEYRRQGLASTAIDLLRLSGYIHFSSTRIGGLGPQWWAGYRDHRPDEITADPRQIGPTTTRRSPR